MTDEKNDTKNINELPTVRERVKHHSDVQALLFCLESNLTDAGMFFADLVARSHEIIIDDAKAKELELFMFELLAHCHEIGLRLEIPGSVRRDPIMENMYEEFADYEREKHTSDGRVIFMEE